MFENLNLTLTLAQAAAGGDGDTAAPAPDPAPADLTGDAGGATTRETTTEQTGELEDASGGKTPDKKKDSPGSLFSDPMFMFLILGLLVFWVFIFSGPRREKKKKKQMLAGLSKNDRVVTIGGVIGTVVEIKDNEVVLKVDESSNTRMRFSRNAIQGVVSEETNP